MQSCQEIRQLLLYQLRNRVPFSHGQSSSVADDHAAVGFCRFLRTVRGWAETVPSLSAARARTASWFHRPPERGGSGLTAPVAAPSPHPRPSPSKGRGFLSPPVGSTATGDQSFARRAMVNNEGKSPPGRQLRDITEMWYGRG